ncbi:efflux RND transporter periplasmic adaptor subunit [Dokdonella sp.]|uniref:efflux RND transporter periplasmic adaptor subunit n=1 Tax=Dokdonella sp. TaxID=2291710 RepID=UPI00262BA76A|nr:efflux RND transporter periplasmic adaptor subunit [Dokdonella sp.]
MENKDLLHQLRIDRGERDEHSRAPIWIGAIVLLLVAAGAGAWWLLPHAKAFEVEVATAAAAGSGADGPAAVLQATGYVTARRQATVSAQITGTLTQVLIEEGERVEAGQVLATLEDTAQKAALAQAQAGLRAAQAQLAQFQAQLAQSRRDLGRAEELAARKLVPAQAAEAARTQVDTQSAQLEAQRKQVEVADAGVRAAQVQLDYCTVRAPFSGVITAKAAQVGEIVSPLSAGGGFTRTGVGTIVDMDSLEIEVDVTESYINRVQPKQPAQAVLDAYPDWKIPAHVIAIIPSADRGKATVKVRVALEQKDPRLLPEMGVRVSFLEEAKPATTEVAPPKGALVPGSAIVRREGKDVVFAVDGERVRARTVTPGPSFGDLRAAEGVTAGERVVREPPVAMADGAKIEIKASGK